MEHKTDGTPCECETKVSKIRKITYNGGEIITELDTAIKETMSKLGYKCWASGMELETGIRDLAFTEWVI